MPRPSKGARLYYRKPKGRRPAIYTIRDGERELSTGTVDRRAAEEALGRYLIERSAPAPVRGMGDVTVSEVLTRYGEKHAPDVTDPARIGYAIDALDAWWGDLPVSSVSKETCKKYAAERDASSGTVRRELGTLVVALNHCNRTLIAGVPAATWLPPRPPSKERWLKRDEAARLVRGVRADPRTRHLARFVLIALYTGSRKTAILGLKFHPHKAGGHVDTERGVLYRRAEGTGETRKRTPPIRIPPKLLAHLRRWER